MSNSKFAREPLEGWNPTKYKVGCCEDVIWSRYPGHCCSCKCTQESYVDQTRYYTRLGGNFKFEIVEQGTEYVIDS